MRNIYLFIFAVFFMFGLSFNVKAEDDDALSGMFAYVPKNPNFAFSKSMKSGEDIEYSAINNDYYMAIYPVTNIEYKQFLLENASHPYPKHWVKRVLPKGTEYHPVVGVSYFDAKDYIDWYAKKFKGYKFRLPTEAEWENAAKGPNATVYPWGNKDPEKNYLNYSDLWKNAVLLENGKIYTTAVDHYEKGRSYYDIFDMSGNAWEWTSSDVVATKGREKGKVVKAVRGGSWYSKLEECQAIYRGQGRDLNLSYTTVGFRIVAEKE